MIRRRSPLFLINIIIVGFVLSALYGAVSAAALWSLDHTFETARYIEAYFVTFNCAISGGFVFATAQIVYWTQNDIPATIEKTFTQHELSGTPYYEQKRRFLHRSKTITLSTTFAILAFIIFYLAKFPFEGPAEYLLIIIASIQYASGVYVGRKIFYIASMLGAIEHIRIERDIFAGDELSQVSLYVNSISTVTVIMVFVGVYSYYFAPFEYNTIAGVSIKTAMLLPMIISVPVLLFNYYQHILIRSAYEKSIELSLRKFKTTATNVHLSEFERLSHMLAIENASRIELKNRLRTTLEDLPLAVGAGIALLTALLRS